MRLLFLLFNLLIVNTLTAQREAVDYNEAAYFDFNDKIKAIYSDAIHLRFKQAKVSIQSELSRNSFNLMPYYIDDYIDFMRMFINESPLEYKSIKDKKEGRAARLASGDDASPYCLYAQAELFLHWAIVELKFGDDIELIKDIKRAYIKIEENMKRFPSFIGNKKTYGLLNIIASTLSPTACKALDIAPSMRKGIADIQEVLSYGQKNPNFEFYEETQVLFAMVLMHLGNENPDYWKMLTVNTLDYKISPMAAYLLATINMRTGNSSKALLMLDGRPKGDDYYQFDYLEYLTGLCKLYKMDAEGANCLLRYTAKHTGNHHIKDAFQKTAWWYLIKGDTKNYTYYMGEVLKRGDLALEPDAMAQEEALAKVAPPVSLVKAQLYYDGGYYENASAELLAVQEANFKNNNDKLWYYHLMARTYHKKKEYDNAFKYYGLTYNLQKNNPHYYACNAALQMGFICEMRKDNTKAKEWFAACLKLTPNHYRAMLHGQAQSRLDVLGT